MSLPPGSRERAAEVLQTFCAEAAVLLLVFPLLDEFVQHGRQGLSWNLLLISGGLSAFFLTFALLIAALVRKEH